ncbi:MAG: hypothetical protein D4R65_14295 [Verrucomicrobiaceae bacterium]|nr:MAG: hypothetical protein D4R65_14295 [Verrucomicrobiaceae bacterium]
MFTPALRIVIVSLAFLSGLHAEDVQRDAAKKTFPIAKELPSAPAWPTKANPAGFDVVQTNIGQGDEKHLMIRNTKTGETLEFDAEGRMTAPCVLEQSNGWPQIELQCGGPPEFYLRKLYRVEEGGYRCVRTDELTRIALQAPEGAPLVTLEQDFDLYWIRSHETKPGDSESFEDFTVDYPSPDHKFIVRASYSPQQLQKVEIVGAAEDSKPRLIYGTEDGSYPGSTCGVLWRPASDAFAFYLKDAPRVGATAIFTRQGNIWKKLPTPEITYPVAKRMDKVGAKWQDQFEEPLQWADNRTLILDLNGFFTGAEGEDYHYHATVHWDKKGKTAVTSVQAVPAP